ncbi:hypothetical protein [Lactobacillus delbrueckii]|uniref:Uncharacterized protein n=1 Tax=Lactobacillus delbrueckii TaxID=1584 RepID=A0ABD0ACS6_9LACO|nr:hypothetical protein [Lactobacillus delbrueckii]RXS42640.1 hypothetical protein EST31_03810 [Lactobacillus delbrueckii subsp. bulgaricus]GHN17888.1 hypothetical protein ME783_04300 [Lactobacillus delbrueckii]GHN32888.1 hypothetical protein ME791_00400 [Lactobacillus delbrueckii]GHN41305.1 hypothetical protein ME796_06540 [Lactobacillus delbrueckii]
MEGRDFEIYFSEYEDHVKEIVKNYPEKTRFYSVGGDGFFNQVIHRQMSPEAILKVTLDSY